MVSNWKPGVTVSKYRGRGTPEWFWNRVDRSGGPDACWPWKLRKDKDGYGQVTWLKKKSRAHRIASIIAHGPIDDGKLVMHRCDNPPCCNPAHLVRGSNDQNMADRRAKGRHQLCGFDPIITDPWEIEVIRGIAALGVPLRDIGRQFGVTRNTIRRALEAR